MFEVRTNSPLDDRWKERDAEIKAAAGRLSDFSGAGVGSNRSSGRDHGWNVPDLAEAVAMRLRLSAVEGVTATVREM